MANDDDDEPNRDLFGRPYVKGSRTSRAAARTQTTLKIVENHRKIQDFLRARGKRGAIDEEMQLEIPMHHNTHRPRRVDLMKHGLIVDSYKTRLTIRRTPATVWVLPEFLDPTLKDPLPAPAEPP